jgi:hypothetical protein
LEAELDSRIKKDELRGELRDGSMDWRGGQRKGRVNGSGGGGGRLKEDAFGMGVEVESAFAEKPDEGDLEFVRGLGGEVGRGADGTHEGNAGEGGFLDEFKAGASAKEKEVLGEGDLGLGEGVADEFVDGVVATDVFAQGEEFSGGGEEGGGVEAACGSKCALLGRNGLGKRVELRGGDLPEKRAGSGGAEAAHGLDAGFAADAAAGAEEGLAFEQNGSGLDVLGEFDADDVVGLIGLGGGAMADGADVVEVLDDSLGKQEAEHEFEVVARGAHGDGEFALGAICGRAEAEVNG